MSSLASPLSILIYVLIIVIVIVLIVWLVGRIAGFYEVYTLHQTIQTAAPPLTDFERELPPF